MKMFKKEVPQLPSIEPCRVLTGFFLEATRPVKGWGKKNDRLLSLHFVMLLLRVRKNEGMLMAAGRTSMWVEFLIPTGLLLAIVFALLSIAFYEGEFAEWNSNLGWISVAATLIGAWHIPKLKAIQSRREEQARLKLHGQPYLVISSDNKCVFHPTIDKYQFETFLLFPRTQKEEQEQMDKRQDSHIAYRIPRRENSEGLFEMHLEHEAYSHDSTAGLSREAWKKAITNRTFGALYRDKEGVRYFVTMTGLKGTSINRANFLVAEGRVFA